MNSTIELEQRYCAHGYDPLPIVFVHGEGVYLWDNEGKNYLDMMSGYSAVSLGHGHPRLLDAMVAQARRLAVVSRGYYTDTLAPFLERICQLTGQDRAVPMNTAREARETALKVACTWAHKTKGVDREQIEIIACEGTIHGSTIEQPHQLGTGLSSVGFKHVAYGNAAALEEAVTPNTAAFFVEPIRAQGIVVPPHGYLADCARICEEHNVLLICDELHTGLGRTGKLLACEHDDVKPDGLILGNALGGGLLPISSFLARGHVMDVFTPGEHGGSFAGNPLAAAVALEALNVLLDDELLEQAVKLGSYFLQRLKTLNSPFIKAVRGRGFFIGIEIDPAKATTRSVREELATHGILTEETDGTVCLAPPLVITLEELDWALNTIKNVLVKMETLSSAA